MHDFDYDMFAHAAIEDFESVIDLENQFISEEHALKEQLYSMEYVIMHLDGTLGYDLGLLRRLNGKIAVRITKLIKLIEKHERILLKLYKISTAWVIKLKGSTIHVTNDNAHSVIEKEDGLEKLALQNEEKIIREIHAALLDIKTLISRRNLINTLNKDLSKEDHLEDYEKIEKTEEYYFMKIYKVIFTYEKALRSILDQEKGKVKN